MNTKQEMDLRLSHNQTAMRRHPEMLAMLQKLLLLLVAMATNRRLAQHLQIAIVRLL
jgi:hypothetical protein